MDYKSAYYKLFNKMTDLIIEIQNSQFDAEDIVTSEPDPDINILFSDKSDEYLR